MSDQTTKSFRKYCEACALREACEYTFSRFYDWKSAGGVGCNHPLPDDAEYIAAVLNAKRIRECAEVVKPEEVASAFKKGTATPMKLGLLAERLKRFAS